MKRTRWAFISTGLLIVLMLLAACQQATPTASEPAAAPAATESATNTPVPTEAAPTATPTPAPPTETATPEPTQPPATPTPTATVELKKEVTDVDLATSDGVSIKGTYYRPAATDAPGVVLLHMLGRKRGDWDAFARQLQDAGYSVLAIDLRGHGESGGKREWGKMTMDAAAATDFLRARPEVDPERIVIIGASIGANIAINYGAEDPDVVGVALLSPGLDYRGVKTAEAVKAYGDRPLFIAASSEDKYAAESSRTLDGLAQGPHQLLILKNQGHGTQMLGKDNGLEEAIFQWLAEVTTK